MPGYEVRRGWLGCGFDVTKRCGWRRSFGWRRTQITVAGRRRGHSAAWRVARSKTEARLRLVSGDKTLVLTPEAGKLAVAGADR